jgi:peptidyl-prolyl cis-trans isomerase A (cyclophilin A)
MKYRIALLLGCASAPALPQTSPTPSTQAPAPKEDLVPVAIDTSLGRIVIGVDRGRAPITAANFLHYVDTHRFDGETFYRAMHSAGGGLIQGGVRSDVRKLYPPIAHEGTNRTGIHNVAGAISMARLAPGSEQADFFILVDDIPAFDAGGPGGDADGFAAFGHVLEGMDVVRKIYDAPVSATRGEGPMKGQMLEPPIKIVKVERVR